MHMVCICDACACGVHMWCMCKAWLSTFGSKCVKHTTSDQNMINMYNHGNPQILVLIGVQTTPKCHLGILSNTWYAPTKLTCKQCMNMSESCLNTC